MNSKFMPVKYLAVVLLAVVALMMISYDAFSQSEIDLGNTPSPVLMDISRVITKEVVRYEPYQTTCTREVPNGTRYSCSSSRTERHCRKVSGVGEECWDDTEEVCSEETAYTTETYSCIEQVRVVDNVYDYTVHAKVEVLRAPALPDISLDNCSFGVNLKAATEDYYANCSNAILRVRVLDRTEVMNGRDKVRAIKVELNASLIEDLNALKFGLKDLDFKKGSATFIAGDLSTAQNFKLSVKLVRDRILLKDKTVFERTLKSSDYKVKKMVDGRSKIIVDLVKLTGGFDSTKKHKFTVNLQTLKGVDIKGAINIPALSNEITETIVINN